METEKNSKNTNRIYINRIYSVTLNFQYFDRKYVDISKNVEPKGIKNSQSG